MATTIVVHSTDNLQTKLDSAIGGDTVVLDAGATWTGNFVAKPHSGGYITVISSAQGSFCSGNYFCRVGPSNVSNMATIKTNNTSPALVAWSANHAGNGLASSAYWNFVGIEFTADSSYLESVVNLGDVNETSLSQLPKQFIFNQCYIHPGSGSGTHGLLMNAEGVQVQNSTFDGFYSTTRDTNNLGGWNGDGIWQIINNQINGAAEGVWSGGAIPSIANQVPGSIMILGNDFYRDPSHYTNGDCGKNFVESKVGGRIFIHANTFDGVQSQDYSSCSGGQNGFSIVLSTRSENGQVTWASNQDIGVTKNIFRNSTSGVLMSGADGGSTTYGFGRGFFARDNYFSGSGSLCCGHYGSGRTFLLLGGWSTAEIIHNTAIDNLDGMFVFDDGNGDPRYPFHYSGFTAKDNISQYSTYGNGNTQYPATTDGTASLNAATSSSYTWDHNVINDYGFGHSTYPSSPGTMFVSANSSLSLNVNDYAQTGATASGYTASDGDYNIGAYTNSANITINKRVMIVNKASGYCLMPSGGSTSSSASIVEFPCYYGESQMWTITDPGTGTGWKVTNYHSGLALAYNSGSLAQQSYSGASGQIWNFTNTGHYQFFKMVTNASSAFMNHTNYDPAYNSTDAFRTGTMDADGEYALIAVPSTIVGPTAGLP